LGDESVQQEWWLTVAGVLEEDSRSVAARRVLSCVAPIAVLAREYRTVASIVHSVRVSLVLSVRQR
jgi:hypothetical protein